MTTILSKSSTTKVPYTKHGEAIIELQKVKGKTYSQVLTRFLDPAKVTKEAPLFFNKMANTFAEHGVSDDDLPHVLRRLEETEFNGTSYTPLPDKAGIVRVIREVLTERIGKDTSKPEPLREAEELKGETYGGMISGDGEKIIRDRRFFYNMIVLFDADLFSVAYPQQWIDEAYDLMDAKHKELYINADILGKTKVLKDYYQNLNFPKRKFKTYSAISNARTNGLYRGISWTRFQ